MKLSNTTNNTSLFSSVMLYHVRCHKSLIQIAFWSKLPLLFSKTVANILMFLQFSSGLPQPPRFPYLHRYRIMIITIIIMSNVYSGSLYINNCSNTSENSAIDLWDMPKAKQFMDTLKNAYFSLRLHNLDTGRKQCNIVHVLSNGTDNGSIAVTFNDLTLQWQHFVLAHTQLEMLRRGMGTHMWWLQLSAHFGILISNT
jgi:hypothetical protein